MASTRRRKKTPSNLQGMAKDLADILIENGYSWTRHKEKTRGARLFRSINNCHILKSKTAVIVNFEGNNFSKSCRCGEFLPTMNKAIALIDRLCEQHNKVLGQLKLPGL